MRQLHLNAQVMHAGTFAPAWCWPESDAGAFIDIDHHVRAARIAEHGRFDAFFLAVYPGIADDIARRPIYAPEPTVVFASIAAQTTHLGPIATLSTSDNDPYNLARRMLTPHHVGKGRAGWNIVTTADMRSARNFGRDAPRAGASQTFFMPPSGWRGASA